MNKPYVSIQLGSGAVMLCDLEDVALATDGTWTEKKPDLNRKHKNASYAIKMVAGKFVRFHRLVMNAPKGAEVDHKNGNGLDNRKSNLRFAHRQGQCANTKVHGHNTTGHKGVSFDRTRNLFRAYIVVNGKQRHLGRFQTAQEAALTYNKASIAAFGEFASVNRERAA